MVKASCVYKTLSIILTVLVALSAAISLCACASDITADNQAAAGVPPLPAPAPDGESVFGVDKNINMETIDNYLGRDDVAYIDVRMLYDPARFGEIGGDADLSRTIRGFKVVPYPFIGSLSALPVPGAYAGPCLYTVIWDDDGQIVSAMPNYKESEIIIKELFPKDKALFLMCGGGGYSGLMKLLLVHLGWDEQMIYNTGANWGYTGVNSVELVIFPEDAGDEKILATWRADYAYIDFSKLHPLEGQAASQYPTFKYIHYASGGVTETYDAVIIFEQYNTTFTAYQVAFVSCTCRDPIANYFSVAYVELLNTRDYADEAAIRSISFSDNMGLYGDSNPNYYIPEYTQEYMDEHFVQMLVRSTKAEFDSWPGYGTQLGHIDADAVTGASVSTANITSMLKGLFEYHTAKYY